MNFGMQKAILLAKNINEFIKFVHRIHENKMGFKVNKDKWYQIKLLIKEFKFQIITDELIRINRFEWDEKYTLYLVDSFLKGFNIIDEYVNKSQNDLFLISGRLHTLKNLSLLIVGEKEIINSCSDP